MHGSRLATIDTTAHSTRSTDPKPTRFRSVDIATLELIKDPAHVDATVVAYEPCLASDGLRPPKRLIQIRCRRHAQLHNTTGEARKRFGQLRLPLTLFGGSG